MNEDITSQKYSRIIEEDLELIIDLTVNHAMKRLKIKFPNEKEFDLIARDFTTTVSIDDASNDPSILLSSNPSFMLGLVREHYVGDAVSAVSAYNYFNKKSYNPKKCNLLLEMLRNVSLISELDNHVGYDNFVDWMNREDHNAFYSIFEKNHPELFSLFGYESTVDILNPIVQSMIERAYRSDGIQQDYIDKAVGVKEKVKSVFKWYEEKSDEWWNKEVRSWFPKFKSQKHRRITCVEIVPKSFREDYVVIGNKIRTNRMYNPGELGGKVLKISNNYNDMREEFTTSQGNAFFSQPECLNGEISKCKLDSLRFQSFLEHCDRCYIAPQMIEKYLELMKSMTNADLEMKENRVFRNDAYKFVFAAATVHENLHYLAAKSISEKKCV